VQFFGDYTRARVGPSALIPSREALAQRLWLHTLLVHNRRKLVDTFRLALQEYITYCKVREGRGGVLAGRQVISSCLPVGLTVSH
jgi:hypothetical protein